MTDRKPPQPPPRFESYRPAQERPEYSPRPTPQQGYPPQGYAPRPGQHPGMPPQRRPHAPPSGTGSPLLTGALYSALAVIALAVIAVGYLVMAMPTDVVRDRVVAEVKARTGRDLIISGPASFSLYPSLGVSLGSVSLSGTPGTSGKPLITMAALDVSVRLWPLVWREVRVSKLVLRKPEINLEVDSQGRTSWDFARPSAATASSPSLSPPGPASEAGTAASSNAPLSSGPGSSEPPASESGSRSKIEKLELGDVRIEDGTIRYAGRSLGRGP